MAVGPPYTVDRGSSAASTSRTAASGCRSAPKVCRNALVMDARRQTATSFGPSRLQPLADAAASQPPPLLPRRTGGQGSPSAVAPPLPHRRAAAVSSVSPAAAAVVPIDAIRTRGCANDYVDSSGFPIGPLLPPKPASLAQTVKKSGRALDERSLEPPTTPTSCSSTAALLPTGTCHAATVDASRHNLLNERRESDRLRWITKPPRSSPATAVEDAWRQESHSVKDSTRGCVALPVELCPLSPATVDAAAVVIISQPLAAPVRKPGSTAVMKQAAPKVAQPKAVVTVTELSGGGAGGSGAATARTILCPQCHECRCRACTEVRRLPETKTTTCCGSECRCSADACVESASCMCCVRGLFYHCVDGGGGEDFSAAAEDPCACCERPLCCARWTALSMLATTCLPCLCCYWPMRGCVAAATACYNCGRRKGCRCEAGGGAAMRCRNFSAGSRATASPAWPSGAAGV